MKHIIVPAGIPRLFVSVACGQGRFFLVLLQHEAALQWQATAASSVAASLAYRVARSDPLATRGDLVVVSPGPGRVHPMHLRNARASRVQGIRFRG